MLDRKGQTAVSISRKYRDLKMQLKMEPIHLRAKNDSELFLNSLKQKQYFFPHGWLPTYSARKFINNCYADRVGKRKAISLDSYKAEVK